MPGLRSILNALIPVVQAQSTPPPKTIHLPKLLDCSDLLCVLGIILNFLVKIAIPVVAIMVVVGAIQIITAGGNSERVTTGRKTIQYAIFGFVALLLASSVVPVITSLLAP